MKKVMIIALILVGALLVPAVSAETIYDRITDIDIASVNYNIPKGGSTSNYITMISCRELENLQAPITMIWFATFNTNNATLYANSSSIAITPNGGSGTGTGTFGYVKNPNGSSFIWLTIDEFEAGKTGAGTMYLSLPWGAGPGGLDGLTLTGDSRYYSGTDSLLSFIGTTSSSSGFCGQYTLNSVREFNHDISIDYVNSTELGDVDSISVSRRVEGVFYPSTVQIIGRSGLYADDSGVSNAVSVTVDATEKPYSINIFSTSLNKWYNNTYLGDTSGPLPVDNTSVTVYVRNSQTGALLANVNLVISANVDGNFHEVVNETVPSGIYSIDLQPTGGGKPNPDYYRLWVTLDGYNSQMPYMDFDVSGGTSVYVYMEPNGEPPLDENMTFVEFYVRDIYANPLTNADVNCGGYTLKTNSAGYTQFELPKNVVYSYSVSKTGYMTIEGIATVENDGRYTVNVALMAGVVPTQTVVTPTITVEPTPTQTTPPIQEDNIIGLSVKGLAKGFGIEYDTALLMFGLMIIFGAGGMVMSSVKGGAMEFIAGSIVGTFVAFALGLIPIWIFIIIAVVFGAYVLRVFVQGSQ